MAVRDISQAKEGAAVDAQGLAEYLAVSEDRAYRMLRNALEAGVIERANKAQKGNAKLYLPARLPRFVPNPSDVLAQIPEIATPVEFVHPLTGGSIKLRRRKN